MKKIPNHVENLIITLFYVLVIHNITFKPKSVTKSSLFLLTFSVLLCFVMLSVIPMCAASMYAGALFWALASVVGLFYGHHS